MVEHHRNSAVNLHPAHDSHNYLWLFDLALVVPDKSFVDFHSNHYSHKLCPSLFVMVVLDKNSVNLYPNHYSHKWHLSPLAMVAPGRNSVSSRPNRDSRKLAIEALENLWLETESVDSQAAAFSYLVMQAMVSGVLNACHCLAELLQNCLEIRALTEWNLQ